MKLVQVRECDGKCCEEKPRFPTVDGLSCQYLKEGKCLLQSGEQPIPEGSETLVQETCIDWPHNSREGRDTGGCCWQWIDGD